MFSKEFMCHKKILEYMLSDVTLLYKAVQDIHPSKYESSIVSYAIKERQEHVIMESFLLTPVKRMSQSTKKQGQCSFSPKRNQQFSILIPIYI